MATFSESRKKLKDFLNPYIHPSLKEGIYRLNLKSTRDITFVVSIAETLIFFYYMFFNPTLFADKGIRTSTIYSIVISAFFCIISLYALNDKKHPFSTYRHVCIVYYLLIVVFGMYISFCQYSQGRQMFVFFATVFCLVNFVLLPPAAGGFLIWGSYLIFYLILYSYDGAKSINLFSYIIFALLTAVGSFNKYKMQAAELERMHRIERMNDMLQNVPVHDNQTDMKNRYALRDDFDSYQNHHIIVIMLDIDDFDKLDEKYGENTTLTVLTNVSSTIKNHLTDIHSYRYGSDSFLIILQDIELSDALQKLSIWERSMASLTINDTDIPISYTSGYSHGTPRDEDELRLLIEAADRRRKDFSGK